MAYRHEPPNFESPRPGRPTVGMSIIPVLGAHRSTANRPPFPMSDCCSAPAPTGPKAKKAAAATLTCPACGRPGKSVSVQTIKHQVKPEHLATASHAYLQGAWVIDLCRLQTGYPPSRKR